MDPALALEIEEVSRHRIINETILQGKSDVQRFYENKVIFITGGSGFLGKQLIEKLTRSCNYKKIYMLMRPKKQKEIHERMSEVFDNPVYDVVKNLKPDFLNKIVPVLGDTEQLNIGLSEKDRSMLIEEVDIIFHVAATIKFNERIKKATIINVRGTREVLNLGEECKQLKVFIHVSTTYTQALFSRIGQDVQESFYETPVSPEALIQFVETLDETKLNEITPTLIKDWPNTYTFTKRVAEDLVRQREGKMPVAVIRPGIVVSAYREPSPGWIDMSALFGASGLLVGVGLGVIRLALIASNHTMGYVPVDLVNNATIVAAYYSNERWNNGETQINIFAIVDNRNPLSCEEKEKILISHRSTFSSDKAVYYTFLKRTQYYFVYYILMWIMHIIPGYLMDAVLLLMGKQPLLSKVYNKIYQLTNVVNYFMMYNWTFHDDNLVNMFKSLSAHDRIIYNCDMQDLNWDRFVALWIIGLRKYIVKDGLKYTNYAKKKFQILRIIHYIVTPLYLYSLWKVFTVCLFVVGTVYSFFVGTVYSFLPYNICS